MMEQRSSNTSETLNMDLFGGILSAVAGNEQFSNMIKAMFGLNINEAMGDDGVLSEEEAQASFGIIGNFLISLGIIEPASDDKVATLAETYGVDNGTATGVASLRQLDGNQMRMAMHQALMNYVSTTEDIPLETLQKASDNGYKMGKQLACEQFGKCSETVDNTEFGENGELVGSEPAPAITKLAGPIKPNLGKLGG